MVLIYRYVVSDVLEYLTPQSHFGHDREGSERYEDYYNTRYNLEIVGQKDQPLLEVNITCFLLLFVYRAIEDSYLEALNRLKTGWAASFHYKYTEYSKKYI